jgi:hypothetical protein
MQHIVLITRENSEKVTHATVYLCNTPDEAALFCRFINKLDLKDDNNFRARRILMNKEYRLEKIQPFSYDDLIKLDDRQIQKLMQELDSSVLAVALSGSSEEIQSKIFKNMSKRAEAMLKEDMEYSGPHDKDDIDIAKQMVIEAYSSIKSLSEKEYHYGSTIMEYDSCEKKSEDDSQRKDYNRKKLSIGLVLLGEENTPENILVTLFESEEEAYNYRDFINKMKSSGSAFYYAKCIEQMVEYEIEKPLFSHFDKIFDFDEYVLASALAKVDDRTIVKALQGADVHTRERIIQNLPPKTADAIRQTFDTQNRYPREVYFGGVWSIKRAQDVIINAMNSVDKKRKKGKDIGFGVFLKA